MKCVKVLVKGRVHGVGFRAYTSKYAKSLGLKGYVKNVSEGVEAVFSGFEVDQMIKILKEGPGVVEDVILEECSEEFTDFEIRY